MTVSIAMKEHCASNVTFLCPIWKITASDGTVAAYCAHTRSLVFESVAYAVAAVEATRPMQKLGLSPNSIEINGVFDEILTQRGLEGGKWRRARVTYEIVNYLDLSMGSIGKIEGFIGRYTILNSIAYQLEFLSKSDALQPLLGEVTSPIDRNSFPSGVDSNDFTFVGEVTSVTNRKKFKVSYVQPNNNYFQYGVARFTSGNNNGLEMEIKESITTDSGTRTEIELQLDMLSDIAIGDDLELIAGYDGTREQLRDKFSDMEDGNMEPDLPGLKAVIKYPE